ncbi:MAG: antibiotic biosynthesis monooxygenase [Acidobacteriota bacterium]|nr:antibiotic biosynthesis monooxygenase [Acidobacteriota bacterium]
MYVAVWRFRIAPERRAAFLAAYGPQGEWAQFFRRAEGYVGTELLASIDDSDSYVTLDRWRSREDFARFQQRFADEYRALDERCALLTLEETKLGDGESVA